MKVWLVCVFVLFALAQFLDWVKEVSLPLPTYILGGAFLAFVSNYDKIVGGYFSEVQAEILPQPPQLDTSTQSTPISSTPMPLSVLNPVEEGRNLCKNKLLN
jgi:hypothetical protein